MDVGKSLIEPAFEKADAWIINLRDLTAAVELAFLPGWGRFRQSFEAVKAIEKGQGVLKVLGPPGHAPSTGHAELQVKCFLVLDLFGHAIPNVLFGGNAPIE